jgi:CRP/FNR family transcriptional regulator
MTNPFKIAVFNHKDVIMKEGDVGNTAYIIASGEVEVYKNKMGKRALVGRLGPEEMLGELCLFEDTPRTATVIAYTGDVRLIEFSLGDLENEISKLSPKFKMIIKVLLKRLKQNYNKIATLS